MSTYDKFLARYSRSSGRRRARMKEISGLLATELGAAGIRFELAKRLKSVWSTWKKMQRCGLELQEVHDVVGLRILVDDVSHCYRTLEITRRLFSGQQERVKDYIAEPKPNGYRSLHVWIKQPDGMRLEIQIRTFEMHRTSQTGRAAHWRYKQTWRRRVGTAAKYVAA